MTNCGAARSVPVHSSYANIKKAPGHLVFVGLEKERQIGHSQPKGNLFQKFLMNLRKITSKKAGTCREQSDLLTIRLCNFCDWLKKNIVVLLFM
jgi:hypothetical protein